VGLLAAELFERDRVERRPHLCVVVEVDVDVVPGLSPVPDPGRPPAQRRFVVAAGVELFGSVQADVDEVRGGLGERREPAGGIGDDKADVLRTKQLVGSLGAE
jgi:hypothetical protein